METELQKAAKETATQIIASGEAFTNSLMGKGLKPLVSALIKYIKITNLRLTKLEEGKTNEH